MTISYDHYRIFYHVAKYKSFTRAAQALYSNQPNVTRAIKALEQQLGCTLFERSNKGVRLTEDGEVLYEHIAAAIEHIQAGEDAVSSKKSMESGLVTIGASEIALRCYLLPILNEFRQQHPGVRLKILNVSTPQALKMLEGKLVDLAVVSTPLADVPTLRKTVVKEFMEVPVCGDAIYEVLSKKDEITWMALAAYPLISLAPKTATYECYLQAFMQHGCRFVPDIEAATADQILPLVKHNMGIGFVPETFLEDVSGVHRLSLEGGALWRSLSLVKQPELLPPPARALEKMILETCEEE